jgi:hypothetical protein
VLLNFKKQADKLKFISEASQKDTHITNKFLDEPWNEVGEAFTFSILNDY